jgi:hypothetical protein
MTRQEAIELFGKPKDLAYALGVTPQAIYQWPEIIPLEQADRVIGAAIRLGFKVPAKFKGKKAD